MVVIIAYASIHLEKKKENIVCHIQNRRQQASYWHILRFKIKHHRQWLMLRSKIKLIHRAQEQAIGLTNISCFKIKHHRHSNDKLVQTFKINLLQGTGRIGGARQEREEMRSSARCQERGGAHKEIGGQRGERWCSTEFRERQRQGPERPLAGSHGRMWRAQLCLGAHWRLEISDSGAQAWVLGSGARVLLIRAKGARQWRQRKMNESCYQSLSVIHQCKDTTIYSTLNSLTAGRILTNDFQNGFLP